jgi:hypothetical protein
MKKYTIEIKIEASNDREASQIAQSLTTIAANLPTNVQAELADVVSDPIKMAYVKQQLGLN